MLGTILAMEVPTDKGSRRRKCVLSKVRLKLGSWNLVCRGPYRAMEVPT